MRIPNFLLCMAVGLGCWQVRAGVPPGEVVGWGDNVAGEATGVPSYPFSNGVVVVTDNPRSTGTVTIAEQVLSNAVAVCASDGFGLALRSDGTVVGWGDNQEGRAAGKETPNPYRTSGPIIIDGNILGDILAIDAGANFGVALKRDGTVVGWGRQKDSAGQPPGGLSNVTKIAAGYFHCMAVKRDGTVTAWGQPRSSFAGLSNIVAVAATKSWFGHDLALKDDGTVFEWNASLARATAVEGLSDVVAISAGKGHNLALKKDGTVAQWSLDNPAAATVVGLNNVVAISAGEQYSLALKRDGTVSAWGNHRYYSDVPANLTNVVAISAGEGFCLAIKKP